MKKKLIKRLEELAIENEIQKQEISKLNNMLGKEEPKEEEVWWLCDGWLGIDFTKGKKYKEYKHDKNKDGKITHLTLFDNFGKLNIAAAFKFTKVEENKELEEAKEYLNGYAKGAYPIKKKLKKSIETILKHLEK